MLSMHLGCGVDGRRSARRPATDTPAIGKEPSGSVLRAGRRRHRRATTAASGEDTSYEATAAGSVAAISFSRTTAFSAE